MQRLEDKYANFIMPVITNPNYKERVRIISEMMEELNHTYPNLEHTATKHELNETELRLTEKIAETNLKIEKVRADLSKDIEKTRTDLRKDIEQTRVEIANVKSLITKWSFLFWISQMGAFVAIGFFVIKALSL